ncbi:hypothetical protein LRN_0118 [Ligilactobacillus ruminis DPC 6832]|uniref:Uncharacterized protein n=1 Tax=Ligilactobacillus ruminis DPC 6832 TaxID=1402208 RepID=A0A837DVH9_9LACO|nr:hypothetical protein LRN_0118 [Ligilactobacillus ruminis DPC 6832]
MPIPKTSTKVEAKPYDLTVIYHLLEYRDGSENFSMKNIKKFLTLGDKKDNIASTPSIIPAFIKHSIQKSNPYPFFDILQIKNTTHIDTATTKIPYLFMTDT